MSKVHPGPAKDNDPFDWSSAVPVTVSAQSTTNLRSFSMLSRISTVVREFKFKDRRWMWLPISSSMCLAGLCGLLFFCQGLEPKTNPAIFADPEAAQAAIWSPEIIMPCWDEMNWDLCWGQYLASSFFGFCAVICFFHAYVSYRRFFAFDTTKGAIRIRHAETKESHTSRSDESDDDGQNSAAISDIVARHAPDLVIHHAGRAWEFLMKFSPGQEYFWHRAWLSLLSEIALQIIRCFVLGDSYARVNASQTIAQIALMILHVVLFAFFYSFQSEVGYVFVGLWSEMGYLAVRVSFFGTMALRHTSFLDFLTIAFPLAVSILEIQEIQTFIYYHSDRTKSLLLELTEDELRTRGHRMALLAATATSVGLAVGTFVVYKGFFVGCPEIANSKLGEERPEDFLLPFGVDCFAWQFNFFLTPACSCVYLVFHPYLSPDCAGLGANSHALIEEVKPHFLDVRFLTLGFTLTEPCRLTDADYAMVASMTRLKGLNVNELKSPRLPDSFQGLGELSHIIIQHGWIEHVDKQLSSNWAKLEMFACHLCPHLDNLDFLTEVDFQRLARVEVFGAVDCPQDWLVDASLFGADVREDFDHGQHDQEVRDHHLHCSPRTDTEVCEGLPDWFLISVIEGLEEGAVQNTCSEVLCLDYLKNFNQNDFNARDYLYDHKEMQHFIKIRYRSVNIPESTALLYTEETHNCYVNITRSAFRKHYSEDYQGIASVETQVTIPEYLAYRTRYSTCVDCPAIQETMAERKRIYDEMKNFDENDICAGVISSGHAPESFSATCTMDVSLIECHQGMCPLALGQAEPFDDGNDGLFTAAEITAVGAHMGHSAAYDNRFIPCMQERAPECIDGEVNGEPAVSLHMYLRIGFHIWSVGNCPDCAEQIDCSKC